MKHNYELIYEYYYKCPVLFCLFVAVCEEVGEQFTVPVYIFSFFLGELRLRLR
jgi:uncharacterized protein with ATP-grasp and redox domains